MQKGEILFACRAGGSGKCVNMCGRICARLSANLAEKLSSELQMEWAKGQAMLLALGLRDPDIANPDRLSPQLREKLERALMQAIPQPKPGAMPPPMPAWGDSAGCVSFEE
ncbi:MAG: hypothetical protein Q7S95_04230 [bacterium]|nr:hypothetical protein [bacterium]